MKFLVKGIFLYVILMLTVKEKNGFLATAWSASNDGSKKWEEINDDVEWIDQNMVAMEEQTQMQISCVSNMDGSRVCDCGFRNEEMTLPKFSGSIHQIILINCKTLRISQNTFSDLPIVSWVRFHNIEELVLEQHSLLFSRNSRTSIQLEFINTVIEEIQSYSISGNVEQIRFENAKIGIIQPFAVTGLMNTLRGLSFTDSRINRIEPQAFKKFVVEDLEIINTEFMNDVPSRSFYEIEVTQNFRIRNSSFPKIHTSAFIMQEVSTFNMISNTIQQLNGECFRMNIQSGITIRNNTFTSLNNIAFRAILVDSSYFTRNSEPMPFYFNSNYLDIIGGPQEITFNNQFNMRLSQIYLTEPITCATVSSLKYDLFIKHYSDTIYFRMSDESEFFTFSYIKNQKCVKESYLLYIIIGVSILVFLIIVTLIIFLCICLKRRRERKLNIVQPEGKTYRETQIVMQIENHGLLKTDL